jgi:hypothetical protein
MAVPVEHNNRFIYHFTHLDNLESIIQNGLLSPNLKQGARISHYDVAAGTIQQRRSKMIVKAEPGGTVHDYVPFYFGTTNPMFLSLVHSKNHDQQFFIFFAIPISRLLLDDAVFTNASANTETPPEFYSEASDLQKLDWKSIDNTKWGTKDEEEKHKRMAEAMIFEKIQVSEISSIIVWNKSIKDHVIETFEKNESPPPKVSFSPFNGRHFFYTKFGIGKESNSLVLKQA